MIRGARYNKFGTIDCEVYHDVYGWIPYTASPDDSEEFCRNVYHEASLGNVSPYVADEFILSIPQSVSRFQARAALMDAGVLADVELAVGEMGPLEQLAWAEATEWRRDSPTIAAVADALELTSEQVDQLFISASKIVA